MGENLHGPSKAISQSFIEMGARGRGRTREILNKTNATTRIQGQIFGEGTNAEVYHRESESLGFST